MNEDPELREALISTYEGLLPVVEDSDFIEALPRIAHGFQSISDSLSNRLTRRRVAGQPANKNVMSTDPAFAIIDRRGCILRFDCFNYSGPYRSDEAEHYSGEWLRCRVTLKTRTIHESIPTSLLTTELAGLSGTLRRATFQGPGDEARFAPMEHHVTLKVARMGHFVSVTARLRLSPWGPVIEYDYECRPEAIAAAARALDTVIETFPERGPRE